jgi:hypothetical protein
VWKHLILANTVAKLNFVYYIIAQNLKYSFNKVNTNIPVSLKLNIWHNLCKHIFASQGLRSSPLHPWQIKSEFRVLVHYIIINQWERLYYYLFEGTSVNWANTLNVSVNIVLLCLGDKDSWQSLQFSPHGISGPHGIVFYSMQKWVAASNQNVSHKRSRNDHM